jgi:hypothetical protein
MAILNVMVFFLEHEFSDHISMEPCKPPCREHNNKKFVYFYFMHCMHLAQNIISMRRK